MCPICGNMNIEEVFDGLYHFYTCDICNWASDRWYYVYSDRSEYIEGGENDGN